MGISKYIIGSVLIIVAITGYIYNIEPGNYTLKVMEYSLEYPIALWAVLSAVILFVVTLLHMFYYGSKNFFINRKVEKDTSALLVLIKKRLLGETSKYKFKNENLSEAGNILSQVDFTLHDQFVTVNKDIQATSRQIVKINSGEYVPEKELKLATQNSVTNKNLKNRINKDEDFALEVMDKTSFYSEDIIKLAFKKVLETKSMTTVKKILPNITLDKDMLKELAQKDAQEDSQFALDDETLSTILSKAKLQTSDLIDIIKSYKQSSNPERLIKVFKELFEKDEKYTESYLYVLGEYQMIDEIREVLINSQKDEFTVYKAYLDLRDAGKHYPLDTFI